MRWFKKRLWNVGIVSTGMLFLLACLTLIPLSAASAHEGASGVATPTTVSAQATPTEDATVTALNKEQLAQEVTQQQHTWDNWLWSNAATVLSTLVVVIGVLFSVWQWRVGRNDTQAKESEDRRATQAKELKDRRDEREKRAEDRFQAVVEGLGSEREEVKIGAAITLRTFLRPGYEQFYRQIFDLAVAHLRLPRTSLPSDTQTMPLPLTTLNQALCVVFKEAFPLARDQGQKPAQSLDASHVQLDYAYLVNADFSQAWLVQAFLRKANFGWANFQKANLFGANLQESYAPQVNLSGSHLRAANLSRANLRNANFKDANLSGADLSNANLTDTNLEEAFSLRDTDLRGVKGLTKEQKASCEGKGAIIDKDLMTKSPQPTVAPVIPDLLISDWPNSVDYWPDSVEWMSIDSYEALLAQESTPTPGPNRDSKVAPSEPYNDTQAPSISPAQKSTLPPDPDGTNTASSQQKPES